MMDKPLSEWTLGDVQSYVKGIKNCCKCVFYNGTEVCPFVECPREWMFPNFAPQEVNDAKTLMRMLPECDRVQRSGTRRLYITGRHLPLMVLEEDMFPSVKEGQIVKLADIVRWCEE